MICSKFQSRKALLEFPTPNEVTKMKRYYKALQTNSQKIKLSHVLAKFGTHLPEFNLS